MSQIAFFTRDGDMRDRRSRISRPKRGALIRATDLKLTPMSLIPHPPGWLDVRLGVILNTQSEDFWTASPSIADVFRAPQKSLFRAKSDRGQLYKKSRSVDVIALRKTARWHPRRSSESTFQQRHF